MTRTHDNGDNGQMITTTITTREGRAASCTIASACPYFCALRVANYAPNSSPAIRQKPPKSHQPHSTQQDERNASQHIENNQRRYAPLDTIRKSPHRQFRPDVFLPSPASAPSRWRPPSPASASPASADKPATAASRAVASSHTAGRYRAFAFSCHPDRAKRRGISPQRSVRPAFQKPPAFRSAGVPPALRPAEEPKSLRGRFLQRSVTSLRSSWERQSPDWRFALPGRFALPSTSTRAIQRPTTP
jgi:hypothetical protein